VGIKVKKIAVFVEGQTEKIFSAELLLQFFSQRRLNIVSLKMQKLYHRVQIDAFTTDDQKDYFFVIYDCGTDDKVKSDIIENFQKLKKAGFSCIIGIQDLYNPQRRKKGIDAEKYKKGINIGLPQEIPTKIILAVNETEAWFIAEENHYSAISPDLTLDIVNSITGIDIQNDSTETIRHPAVVLDEIYKAGGRKSGYSKNEYVVKEVVSKLDYDNLYMAVRTRNNSLNELLTCLDELIP
jgi:hypothetical protein